MPEFDERDPGEIGIFEEALGGIGRFADGIVRILWRILRPIRYPMIALTLGLWVVKSEGHITGDAVMGYLVLGAFVFTGIANLYKKFRSVQSKTPSMKDRFRSDWTD